jgi:hypothetical protein
LAVLAMVGLVAGGRQAASASPKAVCAVPAGVEHWMGEVDARVRLDWIDARLGEAAHTARWWTWGWGAGVGAAGVFSLAAVPFVAPENRIDWYTGAATAAFGVIPFVIFPLSVMHDAPIVHARAATVGDSELCAALAEAEDALARGAHEEARQRAWWVHAGNVAFNTGVLLFLGLGYHHWTAGLINGGAGLAVGEAMIFTSPTQAIDDLATYRRGAIGADRPTAFMAGWTFQLF